MGKGRKQGESERSKDKDKLMQDKDWESGLATGMVRE